MVPLGIKLVLTTLLLALVLGGIGHWRGWPSAWAAVAVLVLLAVFFAFFFRDPKRQVVINPKIIYAPADGRVVMIEEVREPPYLREPAWKVSIFMNVFNVHVQRAPLAGVVEHIKYTPGEFKAAFAHTVGEKNERNYIGLASGEMRVLVVQIAGLIARRIINWCSLGQRLNQGERMGMIAFGSRVDIYVPKKVKIKVELGQKTKAGITVLGEMK